MIWNSVSWPENMAVHAFDSHGMKGRQTPEYIGILYRIKGQPSRGLVFDVRPLFRFYLYS